MEDLHLIGIDDSEPMLSRCSKNLEQAQLHCEWDLLCEDILDTEIKNASIVILNFTLQFIPIEKRVGLLEKIYQGLITGGVLLLSEKIAFEDPSIQESMVSLHEDFKRAHGYSDLEVSRKRSALEEVLLPESIEEHKTRLQEAGFKRAARWFQCFNFASLIAFKD